MNAAESARAGAVTNGILGNVAVPECTVRHQWKLLHGSVPHDQPFRIISHRAAVVVSEHRPGVEQPLQVVIERDRESVGGDRCGEIRIRGQVSIPGIDTCPFCAIPLFTHHGEAPGRGQEISPATDAGQSFWKLLK